MSNVYGVIATHKISDISAGAATSRVEVDWGDQKTGQVKIYTTESGATFKVGDATVDASSGGIELIANVVTPVAGDFTHVDVNGDSGEAYIYVMGRL